MTFRILILIILSTAFLNQAIASQPEHRMAIDIGSSTTRYMIAEVNPETHKIIKIVDSGQFEAGFQIDLIISKNRQFSTKMYNRTIDVFQQLKSKREYYGVSKIKAIAKQTFRLANNHSDLSNKVLEKTNILIQTISRQDEDRLDYFTASRASQAPPLPVVWDIAADSFQLIIEDEYGEPFTHQGAFGSMTFMDYLLEVVQQKSARKTRELHPVTKAQADSGLLFSRYLARQVPSSIVKAIREAQGEVLTIGSMFHKSISSSIARGKASITKEMISDYIRQQLVSESYEQHSQGNPLKNPNRFSHSDLANAILVYGIMSELGITKLNIANRNTTDSMLEYPLYWQ